MQSFLHFRAEWSFRCSDLQNQELPDRQSVHCGHQYLWQQRILSVSSLTVLHMAGQYTGSNRNIAWTD